MPTFNGIVDGVRRLPFTLVFSAFSFFFSFVVALGVVLALASFAIFYLAKGEVTFTFSGVLS